MPRPKRALAVVDGSEPICGNVNDRGQYYCTCDEFCKGGAWIGRSSFYRHAAARNSRTVAESAVPLSPVPTGSSKRLRTQSPEESEPSSPRGSVSSSSGLHNPPFDAPSPASGQGLSATDSRAQSPAASLPEFDAAHFRTPSPAPSLQQLDEFPRSPTPRPRAGIDDHAVPERTGGLPPDPGSLAALRAEELARLSEEPQEPPSEDDETPEMDDSEQDSFVSAIRDFETTQEFCRLLKDATHQNGPLTEDQISDLLSPSHASLDIDSHKDRVLRHCLRAFLSHRNGSDRSYTEFVESSKETYPDDADLYLSLDQLKRRIAKISGVYAVPQEMCINSCLAYTGAFASLDECRYCHRPRHDANGKPFKTFDTMPVGPQLQALRRHPESAAEMKYLWQKILSVQKLASENGGKLDTFDDIPCGSAILDAVDAGDIGEDDIVLMMSIDGAQLYRMKASDCWIYIWIVVNLSPGCRYKQRYLIPGAFIPGPRKPVHLDSFLYVGLHHISAVNNAGGLPVFDAVSQSEYLSRIYILLALADGAASIYLSGLVTHSGKYGCRIFCGMPGRRKPGDSHYWPACLKPDNYDEPGCAHDDIDPREVRSADRVAYEEKLAWVGRAPNASQYDTRRLETGISKPTIFSGLAPTTILGAPHMLTEDLMHMTMNTASAIVELFHGSFPCARTDSVNTWAWAIFRTAELWQAHGRDVANSTPFIPGSWGRAPRNPAEKINSGYKAWEYLLYIFSLGPGLFVGLLPEDVYRAYCKLVRAFRLLYQKSIKYDDVYNAHVLLTDFIDYYEHHFYQRRVDRLQLVRPCIHNLSHLASEVPRVGPGCGVAQWTLERFIGLITDELKQHKHPYAHLSRRALERAQINALTIMMPSLELKSTIPGRLPHGHEVVSDGYALLRARDSCARELSDPEEDAVRAYFAASGIIPAASWLPEVVRWSRLLLPNGQVARSAWKECLKTPDQLRRARDVKVRVPQPAGPNNHLLRPAEA